MKFTVNEKIGVVGSGILVLLMGFIGTLIYHSLRQWSDTERWIHHAQESVRQIEGIYSSVVSAESAVRAYVITGRQDFLAPYQKTVDGLGQQLRSLRQIEGDDSEQAKRAAVLTSLVKRRLATLTSAINLRQEHGSDASRRLTATGQGARLTAEVHAVVEEMVRSDRNHLRKWKLVS